MDRIDEPDSAGDNLQARVHRFAENATALLAESREQLLKLAAASDPDTAVRKVSIASGLSVEFLHKGLERPWTLMRLSGSVMPKG